VTGSADPDPARGGEREGIPEGPGGAAGPDDLAESVLRAFRSRGWTVALAESCTGGLVAKRLTDIPGSSEVVLGAVVAYHDDAKADILDVPREMLRAHGAVSEPVAEALARGAAHRFRATVGLGVTGIAGPGGGSDEKPVGTVWFGIHRPDGSRARRRRFEGSRLEVRSGAAEEGLTLLLETANSDFAKG
jgi:nicotinamide-nucleotide amidase